MTSSAERSEAAGGLWARIIELAGSVDDTHWHRPTPCEGWDVHDLVGHLSGIQVGFDTGRVVPPPEGWEPPPDAGPLDAWTESAVAARRGWSQQAVLTELGEAGKGHVARLAGIRDWAEKTLGPTGPTTEEGLFSVRMFDLWVHLQDLREALGLAVEVDDRSPAAAVAHRYVLDRIPYLYGKQVGAPEGSTLRTVLGSPLDVDTVVEVADGRGRFNADADPGTDAVTGSPAALTLLCTGRHDAAHWSQAGLLSWSGDRGADFVARARLF